MRGSELSESSDITVLLQAWRRGDPGAMDRLIPIVYRELHRLARGAFRGERHSHTLQPTALVHEAFLKLAGSGVDWQDRAHFYALAARQMRRILVDHARSRAAEKRGGEMQPVALDELDAADGRAQADVTELDDALRRLERFDARKSEILELYYFGGLTYEELVAATGLSTTTLNLELRLAKAWLKDALR